MESNEQQRKKDYIKTLALLCIQIEEMTKLSNKSIGFSEQPSKNCKDNKIKYFECSLVNRDIIDNYKDLYLYSFVSEKLLDKLKSKNISYDFNYFNKTDAFYDIFIKTIGFDNNQFDEEKSLFPYYPIIFETEKLKINEFEFPYNFFILRKEIISLIFNNEIKIDSKNQKFKYNFNKIYKIIIGKEGVFIWDSEKQKEYIVVYFLNNFTSEINKIYLFKDENEFFNELENNIIGKTIEEYFEFRKIRNKEVGFYNLIDDGKIIFKYINIIKSQNYEGDEIVDIKPKFDNLIENAEQKNKKIEEFLKYLLINLYYIKDLRDYFINNTNKDDKKNKDNNDNIDDNKNKDNNDNNDNKYNKDDDKNKDNNENNDKKGKYLIDAFTEFVKTYLNQSGNNIGDQIDNFNKIFINNNLGENIMFNKDNVYENLIKKVIESFDGEIKLKKYQKNKIFELFYSLKNPEDNNINRKYNAIFIDPKIFWLQPSKNEKNQKNEMNTIYQNNQINPLNQNNQLNYINNNYQINPLYQNTQMNEMNHRIQINPSYQNIQIYETNKNIQSNPMHQYNQMNQTFHDTGNNPKYLNYQMYQTFQNNQSNFLYQNYQNNQAIHDTQSNDIYQNNKINQTFQNNQRNLTYQNIPINLPPQNTQKNQIYLNNQINLLNHNNQINAFNQNNNSLNQNNIKKEYNLNEIINSLPLEESEINNWPKILIVILNNNNYNIINIDNNNLISIPFDLIIKKGQNFKQYFFLSCIQNYGNFLDKYCSIVREEEKFIKIYYNIVNKNYQKYEIKEFKEFQDELNNSFIFFYERKNDSYSIRGSIYGSTAIMNSNSTIEPNNINLLI